MLEHWPDLQQHILPGVLGAVRIANPGINVQIFWETTGKTQDQRPAYKSQRHFNDFPDIDIVGLPQNKLSPLFIRQSIDLFLSGNDPKMPTTRHVFVVAMSNPIDEAPGKPDIPNQQTQVNDTKWDTVATKLQENNVILHVIANPLVRLTRIFEVFRKTMRFQSRQEVIPWQPVDSTHCICHLSGSAKQSEKYSHSAEEWPEVHLPSANPPSPAANSPIDMSDEEIPSPISAIDMINSNPGSLSLVSRMQALHGLASRRRPSERNRRPSVSRNAFFRETSPTPSPRRERLISSKNNQNNNASGNGLCNEKERLRQLSLIALPAKRPPASFSSALDLRGLTQDPAIRSPVEGSFTGGFLGTGAGSSSGASPPILSGLPPPSPGSDASGSTMSSSFHSISSLTRCKTDLPIDNASELGQMQATYTNSRPVQPSPYLPRAGSSSDLPAYQTLPGPASPSVSSVPDVQRTLPAPFYQASTYGPFPQSAYSVPPLPTFSSFSAPYPGLAPVHSEPSSYLGNMDNISPTAHLSSVIEDECEPEVVPASAPPDARGQVPFVFDDTYEQQSIMRLRHAIDSMQEVTGAREPGPSITSSELTSGSWKGHDTAQSGSYIPELPDTFYSVDRGRLEERQTASYFTPAVEMNLILITNYRLAKHYV
ncbi:uncharacterized protein FOMMEDRAFT_148163 [Fomitiporia mediterranea MF3/22]|uniref:uncharacterized protein n=1 Tax=Fomitiporia mediterranea (strain MF3/22) TaxID=694068 RepID=UPI00044094DF|nr:uncharacterized protein FOMMEDRAFT_148163 [Fomitiporia mediterranea MF3/22]EJD00283.1 hypothetical protein FOMMEDRAFT_148163 [Fomitiporia mediterranea MF3/22]